MDLRLTFLGAAGNVTGSCYLVETGAARVLVDCGLFQERDLKGRNWDAFPVPAASVDAVLLTHAHLDHTGRLPRLVRAGFAGPVYCTAATADITEIVLRDSAMVQAEDAAFKQKRHAAEGLVSPYPYAPLYELADVDVCVKRWRIAETGRPVSVAEGITATFQEAGHILGSTSIALDVRTPAGTRRIVFSGDVGRWQAPIVRDPEPFSATDYIVVESTYGNRDHEPVAAIPEVLAEVVQRACREQGKIVIPSFAVERTQELLYHLSGLHAAGRVPCLKVFVDSPMAVRVTDVFRRHPELFDAETMTRLSRGTHPCDFPGLVLCRSIAESKAINDLKGPALIIAGAGMCTGGRIKHHLAHHLGRPENTVLFVGYQAAGTLGRQILEHNSPVRIFGKPFRVAARVEKVNGFSAHADRQELLRWLSVMRQPPRHLFVTHGEPATAAAFAALAGARPGWSVSTPRIGDAVELS